MKKAIIILTVLAACGGSSGWSDEDREAFVAGCEDGGAPNDLCVCVAEKMEAEYPDEIPDDTEIAAKTTEFAQECLK